MLRLLTLPPLVLAPALILCASMAYPLNPHHIYAFAGPQKKQPSKTPDEMTEVEKKAFVEKLLIEKGLLDPRGWNFPKTAFDYAKLVEPHLGVPPKIDLGEAVEIPL